MAAVFKNPLLILVCLITGFMAVLIPQIHAQTIRSAPIYEPDNPTQLSHPDIDRWSYIPDGLNGSVGNINVRYDRDIVPMFTNTLSWQGVAWRGEKINLQIVLWSNNAVRQIRVVPSSLTSDQNTSIAQENITARFVRYVLTDDSFYGCDVNTQKKAPVLVPDILDNVALFDLPANSTRPVWITMAIPAETTPGKYHGEIAVKAKDGHPLVFKLALEVLPLAVPPPSDWGFALDLWQNPWAVARYHDVEPWSEEHVLLLKPLLKMLANAGQKFITTTIIHHPWNGQTYDPYGSMIEWNRDKDGNWYYDYAVFDRYVELCMASGINKYISCYSMICFRNNIFRYYDVASGDFQYLHAEPGTIEYENHWRPFLHDFSAHLKQKGWFEKTMIAMDERPFELMQKIIGLINTASPGLKINLASEDWQEQLQHQIFSYSVSLGRYTQPEIVKARRQKGLLSTFYPCCVEDKPNTYPHSDPAESTWMGWMVAADEFGGLLRWAYNSWVDKPLYDTRYSQWNSGESFLVYPGARSSIRFERLREGIVDYEKIKIAKEKLAKIGNAESRNKLAELHDLLNRYSYQNAQTESCTRIVKESKDLLARISIYLSED